MDGYLKSLFDTGGALISADKLWQKIKNNEDVKALGIRKKDILDYAKQLDVNQMAKRVKKEKLFRPIVAKYVNHEWQIDLLDVFKFAKSNKGYHFILTIIDIYSRKGWGIPVKNKTGIQVYEALKKQFVGEAKPTIISSDNGSEFTNHLVQELAESYSIDWILNEPGDHNRLGIIERFNGTIRRMLFKAMAINGDTDWYSHLSDVLTIYNENPHKTVKNTPDEIYLGDKPNEQEISKQIQKVEADEKKRDIVFDVGDMVRVNVKNRFDDANQFDKSGQMWTREVFRIAKKHNNNKYSLDFTDKKNSLNLKDRLYHGYELQKTQKVRVVGNVDDSIFDKEPKKLVKEAIKARKVANELKQLQIDMNDR